jgi:hypothetical protein
MLNLSKYMACQFQLFMRAAHPVAFCNARPRQLVVQARCRLLLPTTSKLSTGCIFKDKKLYTESETIQRGQTLENISSAVGYHVIINSMAHNPVASIPVAPPQDRECRDTSRRSNRLAEDQIRNSWQLNAPASSTPFHADLNNLILVELQRHIACTHVYMNVAPRIDISRISSLPFFLPAAAHASSPWLCRVKIWKR